MALIVNKMLDFVFRRPWLRPYAMAYGQWYRNLAGYRKLGLRSVVIRFSMKPSLQLERFSDHGNLRYDDLLPEETETVQLALKRLPPKEAYDRVFRLRRAFQVRWSKL